ncbi:unnamed protein product [Moneuplotes crassus]|uniref:Uncharacterized protein n=1 Tax=Euplotes crassus TaxID=5936 RepID=A0AAD1UN20_EUPCR|nr:unnamed protein product [Moneuplotes crassus]
MYPQNHNLSLHTGTQHLQHLKALYLQGHDLNQPEPTPSKALMNEEEDWPLPEERSCYNFVFSETEEKENEMNEEDIERLLRTDVEGLEVTKDNYGGRLQEKYEEIKEVEGREGGRDKGFLIVLKQVSDVGSLGNSSESSVVTGMNSFRIVPFLEERLGSSFYEELYDENKQNKGRGRPRNFSNIDEDVIWSVVLGNVSKRANKKPSRQRRDGKVASICRNAKKVCIDILKYISSRANYKSTDIKEVIKAYAEAFTVGFLPIIFDNEIVEDKIRLFCQFIVLAYPESKVERIISLLNEANYLSFDECKTLLHQIKIRKLSSKASFQDIARQNICFKNIIIKLLSKLDSTNLKDKQGYKSVLSSLLPPNTPSPILQSSL